MSINLGISYRQFWHGKKGDPDLAREMRIVTS